MRLPLFIARRYLLAKKSHNLINIISIISFIATAAVSMAMLVILSAFNGLEGLVMQMYNSFTADIRVSPASGKVFSPVKGWKEAALQIEGVASYWEVLEDNALFRYQSLQHIGKIKGVDPEYIAATGLDTLMYSGRGYLGNGHQNFALLGAGVDFYLSYDLKDEVNPISIYAPDRLAKPGPGMMSAFQTLQVFGVGVFSVQPEIDSRYILIPVGLARELFAYDDEVSYVEIALRPGYRLKEVKQQLVGIFGDGFMIEDRFEQQAFLYKVMRTEKWAIFLILSFILLIAAFNLVGSVTMLILDKKADARVLMSMGAEKQAIRRIFISEGLMIAIGGTLLGLILGLIIVLLQQEFGLVKMGGASLVVDAYPVKLKIMDFVNVLVLVSGIGILASWLPVRNS